MGKLVVVILVISSVIIGYFVFATRNIPTESLDVTDNATTDTQEVVISPDAEQVDSLLRGGASYADKNGVYAILYPNDYKLEEMNEGEIVRVFKQGPTQTGQTEMYDGVIVTFQSVKLGGLTLEGFVDEQIEKSTQDGTSELTSPKKSTILNGYSGFTYTLRGLGEFPYYIIQKNASSKDAVIISVLAADPQNVGFQEEVDAILSTITLLK